MMQAKLVVLFVALAGLCAAAMAQAAEPKAAGRLTLVLRSRKAGDDTAFAVQRRQVAWDARKTAAIVCDMWDKHWCAGATRRVGQMAPRMNELLGALRGKGVLIVHAPSSTMGHYKGHPARKRARAAPKAKDLPPRIGSWSGLIDSEKGAKWPIDQSDGGCDCRPKCKGGSPWRKQFEAVAIHEIDAITDSGVETWNLLADRGIDNVLLLGVHTNMCVIGRPFGLRNLVRNGKNVVLVRDMTDTMYNSRKSPFVSHFRGTELMVEYIERHVCPTTTSADVLGGKPFRFPADKRPRVLLAIAEREYRTWETLPVFGRMLADRCGCSVTIVTGPPGKGRNVIAGFADALARADLLLLSARRRALPEGDVKAMRAYVGSGRAVVGIRTASHAFDTGGKHPAGHAEWRTFDGEVFGGNYHGHYGAGSEPTVTAAAGAAGHPILAGVKTPFAASGSLYKTGPLAKGATLLLTGSIPGKAPEPLAWTNAAGKGRVFYTSLGHADEFKGDDAPLVRLLTNAVFWALDRPMPKGAAKAAAAAILPAGR